MVLPLLSVILQVVTLPLERVSDVSLVWISEDDCPELSTVHLLWTVVRYPLNEETRPSGWHATQHVAALQPPPQWFAI